MQLFHLGEECKPWLLRQHPRLADIDTSGVTKENWEEWLFEQCEKYGDELCVEPIPRDDHERKDPYDELVAMRGTDEGIIPVVGGNWQIARGG